MARRRTTFRRASGEDRGVSLIETVITLGIVFLVMGPVATFLARGVNLTADNEHRQVATTLAASTLEYARSLPTVKLIDGRTTAQVQAQIALAPTGAAWIEGDPLAVHGPDAPAALPLSDSTQQVAGTPYLVRTFVSLCYPTGGASNVCTAAPTAQRPLYRVTASVRWDFGAGGCDTGGCEVLVNTLLDADPSDPLFAVPS